MSGFHVDGLDLSHSAQGTEALTEAPALVTTHAASEEESPALGVSVSLPQTGDELRVATGLVGFLLWVWLARKILAHRVRRTPPLAQVAPRTYQSGWPPPALAPPL